jgi:hypothetical protein
VVCDKTKLDKRGCNGTPDLVIEILSPSNDAEEMLRKFQKYLRRYISSIYDDDAIVPVSILPGLSIDLNALWVYWNKIRFPAISRRKISH